jgi:hypothetical protein
VGEEIAPAPQAQAVRKAFNALPDLKAVFALVPGKPGTFQMFILQGENVIDGFESDSIQALLEIRRREYPGAALPIPPASVARTTGDPNWDKYPAELQSWIIHETANIMFPSQRD